MRFRNYLSSGIFASSTKNKKNPELSEDELDLYTNLNTNSLFPNGFPLNKYTDGEFNKIMDRVGITNANADNFEKLKAVSLKDPFFQKQKETFDNDGIEGLLLNCAGTGSQIIRPIATCAID